MKRIVIAVLSSALTLSALAQDAIDKYFSEYESREDFTKVTVSAKMFELFTHIEGESAEEEELLETMRSLKGMRMIMAPAFDGTAKAYEAAIKKPGKEFEVLMTVDDGEEDITFFITESGGIISELLLIGRSGGEFFILSLLGDIDLKKVAKLSRNLQIDGMQHLQNIDSGN